MQDNTKTLFQQDLSKRSTSADMVVKHQLKLITIKKLVVIIFYKQI